MHSLDAQALFDLVNLHVLQIPSLGSSGEDMRDRQEVRALLALNKTDSFAADKRHKFIMPY